MSVTTGTKTVLKCAKCGKVLRERSSSPLSPSTAVGSPIMTCACGTEYFDEGTKEFAMMTADEKKKIERKWVAAFVVGCVIAAMGLMFLLVGGLEDEMKNIVATIFVFAGLFILISVCTYLSSQNAITKSNERMADTAYAQKVQRYQREYDEMLRVKLSQLYNAADRMKK